jgi:homoserine kinase type II
VAVYTHIDDVALRHMLGIYDGLGSLVRYEGVAAGSINSTYRVETETEHLYLRINEGKSFDALVFEKNLLETLDAHAQELGDVETPRIVKNCIGGSFFPIVPDKQAMLFAELKGRELGIFELAPAHLTQVGAFLARAHHVLRTHTETRPNPFGLPVVDDWLAELWRDGVLPSEVQRLRSTIDDVRESLVDALPAGIVHGDLFINNTKWRRGRLRAVFDWEMAGQDALVIDLAITALAWTWRRESPDSPPAFDRELLTALVDGYTSVRPLLTNEQRAFHAAARFAAVRFAVTRIRDFVVGSDRTSDDARTYLDYREYTARLDALDAMGPLGFHAFTPPPPER